MFTNEIEFDHTVTTVLDEDDDYTDVEMVIDDAGVFFRQYPENEESPPDVICMSHRMFSDILTALQSTEGAYIVNYDK